MRAAAVPALAAVWLAVGVVAQQGSGEPFARAEAAILAEMRKVGIPGAAVAVVAGERVVWTKGFGVANVESGAPVTPDTLFQIGSVTKPFTAAAILAAASQGALALDRPVSTYITGLRPCVGAPTLAQLLSHTGGLIDEPDEFGPQGEAGLGAYQRSWSDEYCMLAPGRAFSYSNSGFALAGLALQEADQQPFADVMKARVLTPLGLTRTTFRPTEAMTWPLAVGHRRTKDGTWEVVRPLPNDARLWPAGTLYSSAREMARFVVALMNDGAIEGRQALPAGVATRMRAAAVDVPSTRQRYGQGLFRTGPARIGHGGTMTGYAAEFELDDRRETGASADQDPIGVIVLTNADGANPRPLLTLAAEVASGSTPAIETAPLAERVLSEVDAARYTGTFRNPRRFTVEVVRQGVSLILKRFGRDFPMRALANGTFVVDLPRGGTETIAFGIGPDGRADYLQMNVWALARVP